MTVPADQKATRWPVWKISVVLYPLAAGAAAVNVFFLSLMLQRLGVAALSPWMSINIGLVLGLPFTWIAGRWIWGLIDQAESDET